MSGTQRNHRQAGTGSRRIHTDAWIPFAVVDGIPVCPFAPTGAEHAPGGKYPDGERKTVDAFVVCTVDGVEYFIVIERGDGLGWALPGGGLHRGEHVRDACTRETLEEADLLVDPRRWRLSKPRYVPDPRASRWWPVTVVATVHLGEFDELPPIVGKSDAARAEWVRRGSYIEFLDELDQRFDGVEFGAHRFVIAELLQPDLEDAYEGAYAA